MDTQEVIKLMREYGATHYPNDELYSVVLKFRVAGELSVPVPKRTFSETHNGMKEPEMLLLACLPEFEAHGMSVKAISNKAGYSPNSVSRVRKMLKSLIRKGFVVRDDVGFKKLKKEVQNIVPL